MSNARFILDDFADATLAATPAVETTMPVTYCQLDARDRFTRSTSIATQVVQGHWDGNERYLGGLVIAQHSGWGGKIRLQVHGNVNYTDDNYDSGTVDLGGPLPTLENFEWGIAPLGLETDDLLAKEAAYSLFFTKTKGASFTLTFSQCQDLYWQFGRIVLGDYIEAPYSPDHGMSFGAESNHEHHRMRGGTLRSRAAARFNVLQARMIQATDAERAAWKDLVERITNRTVGVSLFPGFGGRQERDHVDVMALDRNTPNTWASPNFHESTIRMIGI